MAKKRNKYRIKIPLQDEIKIIIAGFFGGIVPGIGIKTGVSLDRSDWSIMILKKYAVLMKEIYISIAICWLLAFRY